MNHSRLVVADVMKANAITISPEKPVGYARWLFRKHRIGGLPVVENGKLVGIFTLADSKGVRNGAAKVGDVMTRNPKVAFEDEGVDEVLAKMRNYRIGRMPVVSRHDSLTFVGLVSLSDIKNLNPVHPTPPPVPPEPIGHQRNLPWKKALVVLVVLVLIGAAFYYGDMQQSSTAVLQTTSSTTAATTYSTTATPQTTTISSKTTLGNSNWLVDDPSFQNGSAKIDYPSDYSTLVNFTLQLINSDRASAGLSPVSLSTIPSGQQHSDSMAYFGYFSHWDVQGYKPYMRYTLLGGTSAVAENIGLDYCTTSPPDTTSVVLSTCSVQTIENAIANSEYGMMYYDSACCNNSHRDNILDPLHDRVSIGIAYNPETSAVYFTEDFENYYVGFSQSILSSGNTVNLVGTTQSYEGISQITVYYDSTPQPMTIQELDSTFVYDPGTFAGGVFPPCSNGCQYYPGATSVYASVWNIGSNSIDISFSLSDFVSANGPGVYTIYVQTGDSTSTAVSMYSVFVSS